MIKWLTHVHHAFLDARVVDVQMHVPNKGRGDGNEAASPLAQATSEQEQLTSNLRVST